MVKNIVVLISGSGSNLQTILDGCADGTLDARVTAVISNRPGVMGLQRAERAGVPALTLDHTLFEGRRAFDTALAELIDRHEPDLVVLAGFMRILTDEFVRHYQGRMLNIHPSLLPKYAGLHTHQRALDAGDTEAGATVHFVTPELDGGPPVAQMSVPIEADDDAASLAKRVLGQEHRLYPEVIRWFVNGRLTLRGDTAWLDDAPLPKSGRLLDTGTP
uniref:phosphoribosylglycinamide formyltransferase n=1 Tax=Saccharospirillum salsuginis TaxID=418750 RepID=UPI0016760E93|nr:phosphoribosylglycinamide formyltransferase [Saccharospirillum salsuginis]